MVFFPSFSDDSLGYEYPFVLKVVQRGGSWCAWCPWHRFCRGCALPCSAKEFKFGASYLAIDWDQTALHLRYLANQEKASVNFIYLAGWSHCCWCGNIAQRWRSRFSPSSPGSIFGISNNFLFLDIAEICRWHFECRKLNHVDRTIEYSSQEACYTSKNYVQY